MVAFSEKKQNRIPSSRTFPSYLTTACVWGSEKQERKQEG